MIFSSIFLHAVTFSHVLHLDVLKSQIGVKLKVKTEISLCMAIMHRYNVLVLASRLYIPSWLLIPTRKWSIKYCSG